MPSPDNPGYRHNRHPLARLAVVVALGVGLGLAWGWLAGSFSGVAGDLVLAVLPVAALVWAGHELVWARRARRELDELVRRVFEGDADDLT
jgi:hypothetical protein